MSTTATGGPPRKDKPEEAPVKDVAPQMRPEEAPVSDAMRQALHGVVLTKFLLGILAGSILSLVIYLGVLDWRTSGKVNELYDRTLSSLAGPAVLANADQITKVIAIFRISEREPHFSFSSSEVESTANLIADIITRFPIPENDVSSLNQCVRLITPVQDVHDQNLSNQNLLPSRPTGGEKDSNLANCIRIMEAIKGKGEGYMDARQISAMRDFVKDIHENHQSLRTFWISAAQIILINVLLPLLTALLGYIFGQTPQKAAGFGGR